MEIPIFTVDAFTNVPFKGNPAAICLMDNELQDDLYQSIAAEMNLSETAFVTRRNSMDFSSGAKFGLRWFSTKTEVPLCGHATLASAAVLFYIKKNINPVVVFETMSGDLYVRQHEESLIMDFPLNKPKPQDQHEIKDLLKAAVGDLPIQDVCYCPSTKKLIIRLADTCDRSELISLRPEAETLLRNETTGKIKSLIVTLKGPQTTQSGYDFYSRVFAPWVGVPEDPVTGEQNIQKPFEGEMCTLRNITVLNHHDGLHWTCTREINAYWQSSMHRATTLFLKGSAHTVLAGYWSEKLEKKKMKAYQCSSRGGEVKLQIRDDGRLDIIGQAQIILQGTFKI